MKSYKRLQERIYWPTMFVLMQGWGQYRNKGCQVKKNIKICDDDKDTYDDNEHENLQI